MKPQAWCSKNGLVISSPPQTNIYGVALHGPEKDTKFSATRLVMAILGGALMPLVQGAVIDAYGVVFSYIVPALYFVIVAEYEVFDLTSKSRFADNPDAEIA